MSIGVVLTTDVLGLDGDLRDHLIVRLNQNLANLTDLASAYDHAHWNVAGPHFAQLHELFDRFAAEKKLEDRHALDYAIENGRGSIWLNLTDYQYAKLKT